VKRLFAPALALLVCAPLFAADVAPKYSVDPRLDKAVHDAVPACPGAVVSYEELTQLPLPTGFKGAMVLIKNEKAESHRCDGQFIAVLSPTGGFFLGNPWPIGREEGKTIEERLRSFTGRNLGEYMDATVDRTRTADGLFKATLTQTTESGKLPMDGYVDADGRIFFFGQFRPAGDVRASRLKIFEPFIAHSPSKGATSPAVTVIEFSDFQCPSCQRASGYMEPILARHGDKVRYVRYDLPLTGHSWAFAAALAGRAIFNQKPELFWDYKKQIYAAQDSMNALTFWDWARGFASDHELDLARYDADLQSAAIKAELLKGAGTAFTNDIRATPSYLVNGTLVEPGTDGKGLAEYVEKLLGEAPAPAAAAK